MERLRMMRWMVIAAFTITLAACAADPVPATPTTQPPPTPTETAPPTATPSASDLVPGVLYIDGFDIVMVQSVPVQITVVVRGSLADGCTQVGDITQIFDPSQKVFYIVINAERPREAICTDALVPFERAVPLDMLGKPRGTYTIDVNGSRGEFELQVDN